MRRVFATALLCAVPLLSQADSIRVINWNDYIDPAVLEDFQRETGITVDYQTYSTTQEIADTLSNDSSFDVAIAPHDILPQLIENQLLQPLDFSKMPGRLQLDRSMLAKLAANDPGNLYATPYLWSAAGLAVNVPQAEAALGGPVPDSWALLFDSANSERLAQCGISLLDEPRELYSSLHSYHGNTLARSTFGRIQRATNVLTELSPKVRYIDSERYIDDLNEGKLCLAMAWSGDALAAAAAGQPVRFIIPEEGAALSIDSMVIPRNAPRPELAYRLINYLMQPEVAARITNYTYFANANTEAYQHLEPELRENPILFPSAQIKRRLSLLENIPQKLQKTLDQQWPSVLAAQND